jgi:hypothetical protein
MPPNINSRLLAGSPRDLLRKNEEQEEGEKVEQ